MMPYKCTFRPCPVQLACILGGLKKPQLGFTRWKGRDTNLGFYDLHPHSQRVKPNRGYFI